MVEDSRQFTGRDLPLEALSVGGDRAAVSLQAELGRALAELHALRRDHDRLTLDAVGLLGAAESLDRFPQLAPAVRAMAPTATCLRRTLERTRAIAPKAVRA